jgi:hypothetical protein
MEGSAWVDQYWPGAGARQESGAGSPCHPERSEGAGATTYIGVTNNIARRVFEHRNGLHPDSFAHPHATFRLVYAESGGDVRDGGKSS